MTKSCRPLMGIPIDQVRKGWVCTKQTHTQKEREGILNKYIRKGLYEE